MKRRRFAFALAIAGMLSGAVAVVACSNQGEGDRCDSAGTGTPPGTDDCKDGLVCTPKAELSGNADLCCPADRTKATTAACALSHPPIGEAGIPPTGDSSSDSAATEGGGGDSGPDAKPDGSPDSGPDAPSEAAAEGGSDAPNDVAEGG
jgi:hypothetical protein